jgi:acetyl-CoA carboxylase carboxyl transferase subunit beta
MELLHPIVAEWDADVLGSDPLRFPGYVPPDEESVLTGRTAHYALIQGRFDVMGGSMGAAHGERVVRAYRRATALGLPVVVVSASGGARMQEGMVSLIQMARTAAAASDHAAAGLLSVALHRAPTTGGVFASYASLCDLRAATAGATVGFAGPRVAELMTERALPASSHTAESAYRAGLVDAVVASDQAAAWVEACLGLRACPLPLVDAAVSDGPRVGGAWGKVLAARAAGRWSGMAWAASLTSSWVDLHGTDGAIRAGLCTLRIGDGQRAIVIAMERGTPTPAGFRLAQRALALAAKLGLPVVTLLDTPGADPGPESEAGGIAGEIARTLAAMATLPTVSVAVCVGEGGSGGALALGFADRLLMLDDAVFSVIRPEGAAAILDRRATADAASKRAEQLRLTASDMVELGIADAVVPEGDPAAVAASIGAALGAAAPGDRRQRFDQATMQHLR